MAAEAAGAGWDYCRAHYLNAGTLRQIKNLREQLRRQLKQAGFMGESGGGGGSGGGSGGGNGGGYYNANASNIHLLRCVLTAGLYPNVARSYKISVGHKKNPTTKTQLRTLTELVATHPSSINR